MSLFRDHGVIKIDKPDLQQYRYLQTIITAFFRPSHKKDKPWPEGFGVLLLLSLDLARLYDTDTALANDWTTPRHITDASIRMTRKKAP